MRYMANCLIHRGPSAPGVTRGIQPSGSFLRNPVRLTLAVFCALAAACLVPVSAQRVESQKDKVMFKNGVEFKKGLKLTDQGYQYQLNMENKTNEAVVVEVEVAFSNTEISETFEDTFTIEPGESTTGEWTTKVRGTHENALVSLSVNKLNVRPARDVAAEQQLLEERERLAEAQQAVAEAARKQKVGDEWQEQMRKLAEANRRAKELRASTTSSAPEPIKLNVDLVKLLLLEMEGQKPKPDLNPYSKAALNYHWGQLIAAGLVDGAAFKGEDGGVSSLLIKKLTREGREFLAAAKDPVVWQKVSELAAAKPDDLSFGRVKELVTSGTRTAAASN